MSYKEYCFVICSNILHKNCLRLHQNIVLLKFHSVVIFFMCRFSAELMMIKLLCFSLEMWHTLAQLYR